MALQVIANQLWLVPAFPLLGFILLALSCGRMPKPWVTLIGTGSVGLSALCTLLIAIYVLGNDVNVIQQTLWVWMEAGSFKPGFSLYLDGLSLSMLFVITGVGFLIHVYASGYMYEDDDFPRFFTYTNLFVAAMVMLVLADNFALLFLGWEGVGLCSFLLIGFWYKDPVNGYCARKAFVVTRVGDTAFAIGLFLLFKNLGTLNVQEAMQGATALWQQDPQTVKLIAVLLLGGAVGKSAQLPLQTWLPDAMAGPTPVSALIHAATMVTAGVYLIARSHALFALSDEVMRVVALVGVLTLLMSGFTALTQSDLKRVLAYSTISQIGYMFLALGVGAWSSAIFHLMTHAFFKALLFLTAGTIIMSLHHEQNIFKMGGLRKEMPVPCLLFFVGCLCLVAFPWVTSGFWSKEEIIKATWSSHSGGPLIWFGAVLGAFMTALYTFRMFFLVFFGERKTGAEKIDVHEPQGFKFRAPLLLLAALGLIGGLFTLPLQTALPMVHGEHPPLWTEIVAIALPLIGIGIAYAVYCRGLVSAERIANSSLGKPLKQFFYSGWAMDWLYDCVLVKPFLWLAKINRKDVVDQVPLTLTRGTQASSRLLSVGQNGQLRLYVGTMATAALLVIAMVVFL